MKEATTSYKSIHTILDYFGWSHEDYWHINYKVNYDFSKFNYYWDLTKKYNWFSGPFDQNNIPLYLGTDSKLHYSPIFLGHYALGAYQEYLLSNDKKAYDDFIRIADWFVENTTTYKKCSGIWINTYPMSTFNLKGKWQSCLAQAKGISVLCRAYYLTQNLKYLKVALDAFESFKIYKEEGGVKVRHKNVFFWEEYPTITNSIVLNGHIFAVWALYDLSFVLKDKNEFKQQWTDIYSYYKKSLIILKENYKLWDTRYWTRYDIWDKHFNVSSLFYHNLHIKQFYILAVLGDDDDFKKIANKWAGKLKNPLFRMYALIKKVVFRL